MIQLPEIKRKKPRPPYNKPEAIKELERLADQQAQRLHPSIEKKFLAPRKFRDDRASGLTSCIVTYAKLTGNFASRLNNMGVYRNGKYTRPTSRRGLPDILITKDGKSLFIEVKVGKDRMSEYQKEVQAEQEQSGGLYIVASSFEQFKNWFDTLS
jgi:hypothetical protein